jgi:hypothetical protein
MVASGARGAMGFSIFSQGEKPSPAALTPAKGPKVALDELPLMSRLNEEFAKLSEAVLPTVVSINDQDGTSRAR